MTSERYKVENGLQIIEIKISETDQLFDLRDPAPFREKDLDENFTRYLEGSLDELSLRRPIKIQIYIEKTKGQLPPQIIKEAIHEYFEYQTMMKQAQLTKHMKMAQLFLVIGISILSICLGIAHWIRSFDSEIIVTTLREGVVIFGWVSMWKPIELILFDWYPIWDRIRAYRRLAKAEVEILDNENLIATSLPSQAPRD
ncbi:MAG TPA: hypothetical protein VF412_17710 [Bdellovibrio sp.]|uniref:hypothetical protein n=1 Tax=Bdellovibrio sp. TaxID=28201 RepID=UPI002EED0CE8